MNSELLNNENYISWLSNYIDENGSINDIEIQYDDEISNEDLEKVLNLESFYNDILSYASKNYVYPNNDDYGNHFSIRFNNSILQVGVLNSIEISYFCNKIENVYDDYVIEFEDIVNNNQISNVEEIDGKLKKLTKVIERAYNSGIPLEAISTTVNQAIQNIEVKRENGFVKRINKTR